MKNKILTLLCCILTIVFFSSNAHAGNLNFSLSGEYTDSDSGLSVTAGDAFSISGFYDTDIQPVVTYGDGSIATIPDTVFDYSSVTSLNYPLLNDITSIYNTETQPFNSGDIASGSYVATLEIPGIIDMWALETADDYYSLNISLDLVTGTGTGWIYYDWEEVIEGDPAGIHTVTWEKSTLDFNVNNIEITSSATVPEPATMFLLGSGLIGLAGFRRKKKK